MLTARGFRFQVLVVDDGSGDGTSQILDGYRDRMPLMVDRHTVNQGLGATIRDGLLHAVALAADEDIIVTMDADETHTPGLILRVVRMIIEGHDVVIASRFQPGARIIGLSLHRRLISWLASHLVRVLFPTSGVRDFSCGYRAYRAAVLRQAFSQYGKSFVSRDGFECMVDILLKLRRLPVIFGEVPLILRYDLKVNSKMRLFKTSVGTLGLLLRRRLGVIS